MRIKKEEISARIQQLEVAIAQLKEMSEEADSLLPRSGNYSYTFTANFQSHEQGNKYAFALKTLLDLRRQPGTVPVASEPPQAYIVVMRDGSVRVDLTSHGFDRYNSLSPAFEDVDAAREAIRQIGEERIRNAFRIMQGV